MDAQCDKLDRRRLTILTTVDDQIVHLCAQNDAREAAGPSATAGSFLVFFSEVAAYCKEKVK